MDMMSLVKASAAAGVAILSLSAGSAYAGGWKHIVSWDGSIFGGSVDYYDPISSAIQVSWSFPSAYCSGYSSGGGGFNGSPISCGGGEFSSGGGFASQCDVNIANYVDYGGTYVWDEYQNFLCC